MGRPRYVCGTCKKDFTRKWNAIRHTNNQHQGSSEIISLGDFLLRQGIQLNFLSKGSNQEHLNNSDPEEILVDETLSKLAPRIEEMDQLLSSQYDQRAKQNFEGGVIIRALCSPEPVKKFDDELRSIRRGIKCGMVTNKIASCFGIQPIHADIIIRHLLSNSQRSRINGIMHTDIFTKED